MLAGGGSEGNWLGPVFGLLGAVILSRFVGQRLVPLMAVMRKEDLLFLNELIDAGKLTPVIDRTYPLAEAPEAIRYLETGHARGKVVVTV